MEEQRTRAEILHQRADELLDTLTSEDVRTWRTHPCTRILINHLEGDLEDLKEMWSDGGFTGHTTDETVQKNANNIGMSQAIYKVLNWIHTFNREENDDNSMRT